MKTPSRTPPRARASDIDDKRRAAKPAKVEHVPTPTTQARVTAWAGGGIIQEDIARALGITRRVLARYYKPQLDAGKATIDGLAVSAIVRAMQGTGKESFAAAKWWTQSRMGWTEKLIIDDGKLADVPMRVIIELVGDAPIIEQGPAKPRLGFDASKHVQLVG